MKRITKKQIRLAFWSQLQPGRAEFRKFETSEALKFKKLVYNVKFELATNQKVYRNLTQIEVLRELYNTFYMDSYNNLLHKFK